MAFTPFDRAVDAATAGVARTLGQPSWQRSALRAVQPKFGQGMIGLRGMPQDQSAKFRGSFQTPIASRFGDTTRSIQGRFPEFFGGLDATSAKQDEMLSMSGMQSGYSGYSGNPTGDAAIDQAAAAKGVPPAVLKALVNRESSGDWAANNRIAYLRGERMLPYVGIFESTARSWGLDFEAMIGNQQAQLAGMATIIGGIKQQNGFADWGQAAAYYFAGPNSTNPGWRDEFGMSVADYQAKFNADVEAYGGTSGGSTGNAASIWGNVNAPVTYEFGVESGLGYYGYGSLSGLSGTQHTGLDVGVPRGSALYSPGSGVVSCVGWADAGIGGTGGGSCGYFEDSAGGVGNITVRLDNGTYVVLGHSASANVQPGQRVAAGQMIGLSGGFDGDHVHVEARVPDATMQSGYRIVDPRTVLGGGYTGGYQQPSTTYGGNDPRYGSVGSYMQSYYGGWRPS